MPEPTPLDLFTAAGVDLEPVPAKPKRVRKPRPPSPAERAAAGRLEGARRPRPPQAPGQRTRIGQPRDLSPGQVLAYPLVRNADVVAEVIERLPHGYAPDLDKKRDVEVSRLQKGLVQRGLSKQAAWLCARELVHVAYMRRVKAAHQEAGIL